MDTSAGLARTPFVVQVAAKVCECPGPAKELGRARTLSKAMAVAEGYWSIYLAFFGDQVCWLRFDIVDRRDCRRLWRNGRLEVTEQEAKDLGYEKEVHDTRNRPVTGVGF